MNRQSSRDPRSEPPFPQGSTTPPTGLASGAGGKSPTGVESAPKSTGVIAGVAAGSAPNSGETSGVGIGVISGNGDEVAKAASASSLARSSSFWAWTRSCLPSLISSRASCTSPAASSTFFPRSSCFPSHPITESNAPDTSTTPAARATDFPFTNLIFISRKTSPVALLRGSSTSKAAVSPDSHTRLTARLPDHFPDSATRHHAVDPGKSIMDPAIHPARRNLQGRRPQRSVAPLISRDHPA